MPSFYVPRERSLRMFSSVRPFKNLSHLFLPVKPIQTLLEHSFCPRDALQWSKSGVNVHLVFLKNLQYFRRNCDMSITSILVYVPAGESLLLPILLLLLLLLQFNLGHRSRRYIFFVLFISYFPSPFFPVDPFHVVIFFPSLIPLVSSCI